MNIVSLAWVLWMSLTTAGYWAVRREWRDLWLIGVTAAFLVVYSPVSALILGGMAALAFSTTRSDGGSNVVVVGSIALVVALLGYTRAEFIPAVAAADAGSEILALGPLGLSYYCLRFLHYVFERRKDTLAPHGFRQFAAYIFFLPTISVGPVHRFPAFLQDAWRVRWDSGKFAAGLERILYGYVKVTFVSSFLLSEFAATLISQLEPHHIGFATYLGVLKTGINLYILFSGYSDVAIGFALLLGFRIIENFDWPLLSENIAAFWGSWHISVSSWCRDYVYLPAISLTRRPALAAATSIVILGLWHELSYRFLVWALYNALGVATWQWFQRTMRRVPARRSPKWQIMARAWSVLLTFHFVMFGFVVVEQPSLAGAWRVYAKILGLSS